jgi:hypothetical protein
MLTYQKFTGEHECIDEAKNDATNILATELEQSKGENAKPRIAIGLPENLLPIRPALTRLPIVHKTTLEKATVLQTTTLGGTESAEDAEATATAPASPSLISVTGRPSPVTAEE